MAHQVPIDPDKGVNDLVRQLAGDSKKLLQDEVRLAKLESTDSLHRAGKGALWLGLAFGITVVALVAFTLVFATFFGRVANGHYWVGAMLTAAIEIAGGLWLVQRGLAAYKRAPYSLPETRTGLKILKSG